MKFQLGAMTAGDILDRGLKILLSRLGAFYAINLMVLVPVVGLQILMPVLSEATGNPLIILPLTLGSLLLLLILQPIATGAVLAIIWQEYVGRRLTMGEAFRFAFSKFGPLLGTSFLAGLTVGVGFILCILPGVYFAVSYALIAQVVLVEGLSGQSAMTRSKELGNGWRGRILGVLLMNGILSYLVVIVFQTVLPPVGMVINSQGMPAQQVNLSNHIIGTVGAQLIEILFSTYLAVCMTLIYFDLRVRKEGYDLELAAQQQAGAAEAL